MLENKLDSLEDEKIKFCELHNFINLFVKDKELLKNNVWREKLVSMKEFAQEDENSSNQNINCQNEQEIELIIEEYLLPSRIRQFNFINLSNIKMLLDAKIYELYNFVENQDLNKRAFLALLGPKMLAQLEELYPKLMIIEDIQPEVLLYLYKEVFLLNEEESYEYELSKKINLMKELRLQITVLLIKNIYLESLIPIISKRNENKENKEYLTVLNFLREKFEENRENAYLWLQSKQDNYLFNLYYFVSFVSYNTEVLEKIKTTNDVQILLEGLKSYIENHKDLNIKREISKYLGDEHVLYLMKKLEDNEEMREMIKRKKSSRYIIYKFLAEIGNFNKLVEGMDLIDEEVYYGNNRLKEHYVNALISDTDDEYLQKIKKINELAANTLIWYKFMEEKINPLDGKGDWKSLENKKVFSEFWERIKTTNILIYEKVFVLIYENLLSNENNVNYFLEETMKGLDNEMKVTDEEYKTENRKYLKMKIKEGKMIKNNDTKSPKNYDDAKTISLIDSWAKFRNISDNNDIRETSNNFTKWLKKEHLKNIIKLLENDEGFLYSIKSCKCLS
uniref:Uncharacterized protein n=1 Tax=Meloidogyne enterolobii TaxID=390850 RepID=A0A6V7TUW1_MELEN|nr:unnamed protein product [Meloidogyne enterolobii]